MRLALFLLSFFVVACKNPHPYVGYGDRHYVPSGAVVQPLFPARIPDEEILTKTKVVFRFSSKVELRNSDFILFKEGDPEVAVPGKLVVDRDGVTYTFIPKKRLEPFTLYHVYIEGVPTITGGVSKSSHFTFTTDDHTPNDRYVWWIDRMIIYQKPPDNIRR